jgi:hypothetical protein
MVQNKLYEYHSSPIRGHAGVIKTLARLTPQFYWPKMRGQRIYTRVQTAVFANKLHSTTLIPSSGFNSKITYTTQYIIFHAIVEGAVIGTCKSASK